MPAIGSLAIVYSSTFGDVIIGIPASSCHRFDSVLGIPIEIFAVERVASIDR